jgi:cell division protease FtsH
MDRRPKGPEKPTWRVNLLVFIAVGVLIVVALEALRRPKQRIELRYSQFKRAVEQGVVFDISISPSEIRGQLQRPDGQIVSFYTPRRGLEFDQSLYTLLDEYGVDYSGTSEPSAWRTGLVYVLPTLLIIGVFLLMLHRLGGGGSAMAFARSKAKAYGQEEVEVTFEDVAGIDEAVEELKEVVEYLKSPEKYQRVGGRIPKGVLLVGPPGTGKTLLARAVAGEAGVPFFSLSGSEFVEMFVGVGAARVRDLFQQAQQRTPCIVFIDELDALGKTRGGSPLAGHDEREQTLNQLLVEMDGFESDRGVIIMAATNRPETLDPALLRPGRFDRHVVVDRPDINGREAILRVHVRNVKLADDVDLRAVAAMTPGFVGADLANLINEAALLAARYGLNEVGMAQLESGIERVIAGTERRSKVIRQDEKHRIAVHEGGHALLALLLPEADPVHKVSIIPRGPAALGYTLQRPDDDRYLATRSQLLTQIQVLLGGIIAEEELLGECSSGAQNDLERATAVARHMVACYGMSERLGRVVYQHSPPPFMPPEAARPEQVCSEQTAREIDEEVRRIIDNASERVRSLIRQHRQSLEELVRQLEQKESLSAEELHAIVKPHAGTS